MPTPKRNYENEVQAHLDVLNQVGKCTCITGSGEWKSDFDRSFRMMNDVVAKTPATDHLRQDYPKELKTRRDIINLVGECTCEEDDGSSWKEKFEQALVNLDAEIRPVVV